jgi:ribosomal protein S18 acetylase RimI-like enzyme
LIVSTLLPVGAQLRRLTPEDAPTVASIAALLGDTAGQDRWRRRLELSGVDSDVYVYLGVDLGGALVGYVGGRISQGAFGLAEDTAFVEFVGVHPEQQGREIARSLAEALFDELAERDVRRVLTLVKPGDDHLQPFFRSLGFRPFQSLCLERRI